MICSEYSRNCFSELSLDIPSLKKKSSPFTEMTTGAPTYACGHSGSELKDRRTSTLTHTFFFFLSLSSLCKRVGQKGGEVAGKVYEMSETLKEPSHYDQAKCVVF